MHLPLTYLDRLSRPYYIDILYLIWISKKGGTDTLKCTRVMLELKNWHGSIGAYGAWKIYILAQVTHNLPRRKINLSIKVLSRNVETEK